MDLLDYYHVITKKVDQKMMRLSLLSFLLLIASIVITFLSHQSLSQEIPSSIMPHRTIAFIIIPLSIVHLLLRNIKKHKLINGFFLFIIKAFPILIVAFMIFIATPSMTVFGVRVGDVYAIILASF